MDQEDKFVEIVNQMLKKCKENDENKIHNMTHMFMYIEKNFDYVETHKELGKTILKKLEEYSKKIQPEMYDKFFISCYLLYEKFLLSPNYKTSLTCWNIYLDGANEISDQFFRHENKINHFLDNVNFRMKV